MQSQEEINENYTKAITLVDLRGNKTGEYILGQLIQQAFTIFCNKLSNGGIVAKNEFAFQFEFGSILKAMGQLYEFKLEDQFHLEFETSILLEENTIKSKTKKARIDLFIKYRFNNKYTRVAIEIKFFKKENQREPNNRYDVFKDISNLESYKRYGIEMCYFLLITDHDHYVKQLKYSKDTGDFDFRHGKSYKANSVLSYRTKVPYGPDIILTKDYNFNWQELGKFYFLLLEI
jgi:hypothetical protein